MFNVKLQDILISNPQIYQANRFSKLEQTNKFNFLFELVLNFYWKSQNFG